MVLKTDQKHFAQFPQMMQIVLFCSVPQSQMISLHEKNNPCLCVYATQSDGLCFYIIKVNAQVRPLHHFKVALHCN